jgi:predicted anti-sigma-YlaC factor YlaD
MNLRECPRESEILEAVEPGSRWSPDLSRHAETCATCRDLSDVVSALREDRAQALCELRVPPPSLLWWRAELRLRQDRTRRAVRPITLAHAFAAAAVTGVALAFTRNLARPMGELFSDGLGGLASILTGAVAQAPVSLPVLLLLIFLPVVLAPVALYCIFSED